MKNKVKSDNNKNTNLWSYVGENGPKNWSSIHEDYKDCNGCAQSPINIITNSAVPIDKDFSFDLSYNMSTVNIINDGHTIQFNVDEGSKAFLNGEEYDLQQFHFHALSEHTINDVQLPLEVHFVNRSTDAKFVVVAVLFEEGDSSPFFEKYLTKFPEIYESYKNTERMDSNELLTDPHKFFHYDGSFTTPPCTEAVDWIILRKYNTASKEQLLQLREILNDNFRYIQKLNNRKIEIR